MSAPSSRHRGALAVALITGALAFLSLPWIVARVVARGRFSLAYSTLGAGPDGTRGLYEVLRTRGHRVARQMEDVLDFAPGGVFVALGGCDHFAARPLTRPEREVLTEWIHAGGLFVVAGIDLGEVAGDVHVDMPSIDECIDEDSVLASMSRASRTVSEENVTGGQDDAGGVDETSREVEDPARLRPLSERDAAFAGLSGLAMRRAGTITSPSSETRVLFTDGDALRGIYLPRGAGGVVVLASASPFQNRDLVSARGAALFVRILEVFGATGPIVFDEYHLGAGGSRSTVEYLVARGWAPMLLQALVLLFVWVLFMRRRLGLRARSEEPLPVTTASFVGGVSVLYEKADDRPGTARTLVDDALRRVVEAHRLRGVDPEAIARELERRRRREAAEAVRQLAALADTTTKTTKLVELIEAIDRSLDVALADTSARRVASPPAKETKT